MSALPRSWSLETLDAVAEVHDDLRKPVNAEERKGRVGPYPYYGATGQVGWIDGFLLDGEYVLLGEDGAPFLDPTRDKAYLVSGKAWVNNHAHVLRGKAGVCRNRFLLHTLNHTDFRGFANGTTRLKLTQAAMRRLPIRLPPPSEQDRIVAKIEELFSDLDAGVAALERVRANLKRYRAAVLKAAVEGRLTEEWRTRHPFTEPAAKLLERILAERRAKWEQDQLRKSKEAGKTPPKGWKEKYEPPTGPIQSDELPVGWCWATVDQVAAVGTGTTPSRGVDRYYASGTIPWVTSTAVNAPFISEGTEQVTDAALRETSLRMYPAHALLIALYGEGQTRGKVSELLIPATINQALAALTLDGVATGCRPFLKTFLFSNYVRLRSQSAGGVQPNLNLGLVREIAVPLPPLAEQAEIVAEVDRRLSVADAAETQVEHALQRAARLRQAILKRAFEGKLVEQDPTDEPAAALLDRIKPAGEANGKHPAPSKAPMRRSRARA